MLDIRLIREQPEEVRRRLALRGKGVEEVLDQIAQGDAKRRAIIAEVERLKSERNAASKQIGARKARGEAADDLLAGMKEASDRIAWLDRELAEVEEAQRAWLLSVPNLPYVGCPEGQGAEDNPVVGSWGELPQFPFEAKDHVTLGTALGLYDFEAAAKISGSGFAVFKGAAARLQRVLVGWLLDLHTAEHGYVEVAPPYLVREVCMEGTGQLPKFRDDMYGVEGEGLFLAPTAEVPVTNLHREEILAQEALPLRYVAYTPCFRKEAGSAGKLTRGLIRMHQFDKVELVQIVEPERSYQALEELRRHAEMVLERLELPFRTVELCAGDLGFGAAKCYDLEVWAPGTGAWLEVSSCSNFEAFQARRMNLRYKDGTGKNQPCHTLNGSGVALARLVVALLENGQQPDGSVRLPAALQERFGDDCLRRRT
ncbi:MAG: serine--tRNA ligase [Verrucomicrobiia bacterium]